MAIYSSEANVDRDDSEDDAEANEFGGRLREEDLSESERILGTWTEKLATRWKNPGGGMPVYTSKGAPVYLPPGVIRVWAQACIDRQADLEHPPNSTMFDPEKSRTSLTGSAGDTTNLQSTLNTLLLAQAMQTLQSPGKLAVPPPSNLPEEAPPPTTPDRPRPPPIVISNNDLDQMSSPPVSEGDLSEFLTYLDRKKIVLDTKKEAALRDRHIDPSLLASSSVTHKNLEDFGLSFGEARHVKTKAEYWYRGRKREYQEERACTNKRARTPIDTTGEGTQWRISFSDGGQESVWGPLPIPGKRRERDHRLQWRDDTDGVVYKDLPDGLTASPELIVPPDV